MSEQEYPWIVAWCRYMGSNNDYTDRQVERARKEKAPENAIYRQDEETWATTDDITNGDVRKVLKLPPLPPARRAGMMRGEAESLRAQARELEAAAADLAPAPVYPRVILLAEAAKQPGTRPPRVVMVEAEEGRYEVHTEYRTTDEERWARSGGAYRLTREKAVNEWLRRVTDRADGYREPVEIEAGVPAYEERRLSR